MAVQISGNDITVPRDTTVTRNLTVGGVLTYEDVTNVDSIGIVTARAGVLVGSGITLSKDGDIFATGVTTSTTFVGNLTGTASGNAVLTGSTNNQVTTVTGANAITGESGLTYDGSALIVRGSDAVTGSGGTKTISLRGGDANDEFVNLSFDTGAGGPIAVISGIADATGVYPNTTGSLSVNTQVGGSIFERLRIDSSGRIGIGENNPTRDVVIKNSSSNCQLSITSGTSNSAYLNLGDTDDDNIGSIYYDNSNNRIVFRVNTTDTVRMESDGNIRILDGDLRIATSGHGIDFSATGDASGQTSELLDDYEEGTWSPVWSDATSGGTTSVSAQMHGRYTKIGRMVTVHFYTWGLPSQGTSNAIILQGLPYTAGEIGEVFGSVQAGYYNDGNTSTYNLGIYVTSGNTHGRLAWNNAGNNDVTAASFSGFIANYTNFTGTITYLVA